MKITKTPNELTIQETPGCLWFVGLFFAFVGGIFVYGTGGGFSNLGQVPRWQIALAFCMGAISVSVGFWIIYTAPISKVIVDRAKNIVILKRYGLFGKRETLYKFNEIKKFCLIEDRDDEGSPIWSFGMELNDGEMLKITSLPSHSEEYERKYIFETNEFMRKQMPSYKTDLLE